MRVDEKQNSLILDDTAKKLGMNEDQFMWVQKYLSHGNASLAVKEVYGIEDNNNAAVR
jgi:hypothetical protein